MNSRASYTYAIARALAPARVTRIAGIDGAPIHLVGCRDLVAVVSPLESTGAERDALELRLQAPAELERVARAHHAVVEAVAACTVTLPLRLATIHSDDESVARVLELRYQEFWAALERLSGRVELGVKLYRRAVGEVFANEIRGTGVVASKSPGRDYLRQRRQEREQRRRTAECATLAAREVDAQLTELAVNRREHRPQPCPRSAAGGENVLNVAYLVEAGAVDQLIERARRLGTSGGLCIEVTGPWAPYSFAVTTEHGEAK